MTDAEQQQALQELAALRAKLLASQRRIADSVHGLLKVLSIIQGEVDLAAHHGRALIDEFYEKWPEMRQPPAFKEEP